MGARSLNGPLRAIARRGPRFCLPHRAGRRAPGPRGTVMGSGMNRGFNGQGHAARVPMLTLGAGSALAPKFAWPSRNIDAAAQAAHPLRAAARDAQRRSVSARRTSRSARVAADPNSRVPAGRQPHGSPAPAAQRSGRVDTARTRERVSSQAPTGPQRRHGRSSSGRHGARGRGREPAVRALHRAQAWREAGRASRQRDLLPRPRAERRCEPWGAAARSAITAAARAANTERAGPVSICRTVRSSPAGAAIRVAAPTAA